jgi:hypothetical protein
MEIAGQSSTNFRRWAKNSAPSVISKFMKAFHTKTTTFCAYLESNFLQF